MPELLQNTKAYPHVYRFTWGEVCIAVFGKERFDDAMRRDYNQNISYFFNDSPQPTTMRGCKSGRCVMSVMANLNEPFPTADILDLAVRNFLQGVAGDFILRHINDVVAGLIASNDNHRLGTLADRQRTMEKAVVLSGDTALFVLSRLPAHEDAQARA